MRLLRSKPVPVLFLCFLLIFLSGAAENGSVTMEEEQMPQFLRSLPISEDDPARHQMLEDQMMSYQHGQVYSDVNQSGAGTEDSGLLIGGNAASGHDGLQEDQDLSLIHI